MVALLLDKVKTWMRRQGGTSQLRALVYMDEVFGFFPPHPANPPTKRPLLTLLKQARAQGVGVVLATQNPVDLDYKGLANMGTWLVGTLQTQQDRERLKGGLQGAGLEGAAVDRAARGDEEARVPAPRRAPLGARAAAVALGDVVPARAAHARGDRAAAEAGGRGRRAGGAGAAAAAGPSAAPVLPPPFRNLYLGRRGGQVASAHLLVKYAVRYKGADEVVGVRAWPLGGATPADALEAEPLEVDEAAVVPEPPAEVRYLDLPPWLASAGAKGIERALKQRLDDRLTLAAFRDPVTKELSRPGESRDEFAARLGSRGRRRRRREAARRSSTRSAATSPAPSRRSPGASRRSGPRSAAPCCRTSACSPAASARCPASARCSARTAWRARPRRGSRPCAPRWRSSSGSRPSCAEVDPSRLVEETVAPVRGGVELLRYDLVWVY